ncbi:MAG: Ig-like domain-containing protein [Muribaculaceae bacterium]|nr:Ig-like domain-containing protein [Muribaculaceae bacterium]
MRTIYQWLAVAAVVAWCGGARATEAPQHYYDTLSGYTVTTDELKMERGTAKTLNLYLKMEADIEQAFQVDVHLPAGLTPMSKGDTVQCFTATQAELGCRYFADDNSLRLLVVNNGPIKKNAKLSFATLQVWADSTFEQVGELRFDNLVFTRDSDGKGYYGKPTASKAIPQIAAESIMLSEHELTLEVGKDYNTLKATVLPEIATDRAVTWKSVETWISDVLPGEKDKTVGRLRPHSLGTTKVIATTHDGTQLSDTLILHVVPWTKSLRFRSASKALTLNVGDEANLQWKIETLATYKDYVLLTSSAPAVATVDQKGKVRAVAPGQAVIAIQSTDGSNLIDMSTITVKGDDPLIGDVNADGVVDIDDVNIVINVIVKKYKPEELQEYPDEDSDTEAEAAEAAQAPEASRTAHETE